MSRPRNDREVLGYAAAVLARVHLHPSRHYHARLAIACRRDYVVRQRHERERLRVAMMIEHLARDLALHGPLTSDQSATISAAVEIMLADAERGAIPRPEDGDEVAA